MVNIQRIAAIILWLWVAGVSVTYLYQFSDYIDPILHVLGVT